MRKKTLLAMLGMLLMLIFSVMCTSRENSDIDIVSAERLPNAQSPLIQFFYEIIPDGVVVQALNCDIDGDGTEDAILLFEDSTSKTGLAVMLDNSICSGIHLASDCDYVYSEKAELCCFDGKTSVALKLKDPDTSESYPQIVEITFDQEEKTIEYRIISN